MQTINSHSAWDVRLLWIVVVVLEVFTQKSASTEQTNQIIHAHHYPTQYLYIYIEHSLILIYAQYKLVCVYMWYTGNASLKVMQLLSCFFPASTKAPINVDPKYDRQVPRWNRANSYWIGSFWYTLVRQMVSVNATDARPMFVTQSSKTNYLLPQSERRISVNDKRYNRLSQLIADTVAQIVYVFTILFDLLIVWLWRTTHVRNYNEMFLHNVQSSMFVLCASSPSALCHFSCVWFTVLWMSCEVSLMVLYIYVRWRNGDTRE